MKYFLVIYDLLRPGLSYQPLWDALRDLKATRVQESAWVVKGEYEPDGLRDHLLQFMDENDRLFVARITTWAWRNVITRFD